MASGKGWQVLVEADGVDAVVKGVLVSPATGLLVSPRFYVPVALALALS